MVCGIMIVDMGGRYYHMTIVDEKMYNGFNKTLSSEDGQRGYGMKLMGPIDSIPEEKIDGVSDAMDRLV